LTVLGPESEHCRTPGEARLRLRFESDGRRLLALPGAAGRRRGAGATLPVRPGDAAHRDADQLVSRRLSAFRISADAADHPAGPATSARGDGELARRVPLYEAVG